MDWGGSATAMQCRYMDWNENQIQQPPSAICYISNDLLGIVFLSLPWLHRVSCKQPGKKLDRILKPNILAKHGRKTSESQLIEVAKVTLSPPCWGKVLYRKYLMKLFSSRLFGTLSRELVEPNMSYRNPITSHALSSAIHSQAKTQC